ncbi:LemA family protein [Suttonella ornithocola]
MLVLVVIIGLIIAVGAMAVPTYNRLQGLDETVKAQWSEVVNQYQRRADLIPNLVEVTKKYAAHEEAVFTQVAEARSKVSAMNVSVDNLDAAKLQQFQQAQGELGVALSRLIAVSESYPELKANTVFENLQTQLEGTENRITTARKRYIESVKDFNSTVRRFPTNLVAKFAGLSVKPNFTVENEAAISTAPKVQF